MFESLSTALPAGWEPIPDDELASLPPLVGGEDDDIATSSIDDCVADAASAVASGAQLTRLAAAPAELLSDESRVLALQALGRIASHVEAQRMRMVGALAGPEPASEKERSEDWTAPHVAMSLNVSLPVADRLVAQARHLCSTLTATLRAMESGRINPVQARALHDATYALGADVARAVESRVLQRAHRQDNSAFRAALRRAVAALDPAWATQAEANRREPTVDFLPHVDGTAELFVRAPAETTTVIHTALEAYAAKTKGDLGGTKAMRMVHGLHDWAERYLDSGDAPTRHGRQTVVEVLIDLPTLLGLRENPAEIPGVGPIPASAARQLVADGSPMRRLVTDPTTGQLLDYGRATYVAPRSLADFLIAANRTSMGPHSHVPAAISDLDHNQPYDRGGTTDAANLTPLDRRWHRPKTHGGFSYIKSNDGTLVWTSPLGLRCRVDPYDHRLGP